MARYSSLFVLFASFSFFLRFDTALAQGDASLWASWTPLAVRSPYLNAWQNTVNVVFNASNSVAQIRAPTSWPLFFEGGILGWAGLVRIDNQFTYKFLGDPGVPSPLNRSLITNIEITPTRSIMNMTAGPIDLSVTFLSPIEADPVNQSLPFSYMSLQASSNDGLPHSVQVYSDISGEWLSGSRTNSDIMNWNTQVTDSIVYHQLELQSPGPMQEIANQAEDTTTFWAMSLVPGISYMADADATCRSQFNSSGHLTNQTNAGPKGIPDHFNVFAIAVDLGGVTTTTNSVVWAVGMTRNPSIAYSTPDGTLQSRSPYWASAFATPQDALSSFLEDYPNAIQRAIALDQQIQSDASTGISTHYADLVSLAARQAMSGTELTIGSDSSDPSKLNLSDVKMFMKDTGTSGRVNPVEGLYSAFPFFLYINASFCGYLLDPVLEFASSSKWGNPYAPQDIGVNYPNATGHFAAHNQGVEQSGNMLIMTLAHARATGDGSLLGRYYTLLKKWADYLVANSLPLSSSQSSVDTFEVHGNLTNLALKGIIGIKAMSEISTALNISEDAQHYSTISSQFAQTWQSQALAADKHVLTSFGDSDTSSTIAYNLFADKLLKTGLIDDSVYQGQAAFLQGEVNSTTVGGIPVYNNIPGQANTAWTLFTAAYANNSQLGTSLIDQIWAHASSNLTNFGIFPTVYKLDNTSAAVNNVGSPFIGAVFAPLSLNVANKSISVPPTTSASSSGSSPSSGSSTNPNPVKKSSNAGAIAGGVVGGIAGAAILGGIAFWFWRKQHHDEAPEVPEKGEVDLIQAAAHPVPYGYDASSGGVQATQTPQGNSNGVFVPPLVIPSAKQREHMLYSQQYRSERIAPQGPTPSSSGYTSTSQAASSQNPPTEISSGTRSGTVSPSDVQGLRNEVENLRRVMQAFQPAQEVLEPPPMYDGGEERGAT